MSIIFTDLKMALAEIVKTLSGVSVIWSNQNAPTPNGEYIAVKIELVRFLGATDYQSKPNSLGKSETQGDRELILSLMSVSDNAVEKLTTFVEKLYLNSSLELFSEKKMAYVGLDSQITDITNNIGGNFETRAFCELLFRISKNYSIAYTDTTDIINNVGIKTTVNGGKNSFVNDINV